VITGNDIKTARRERGWTQTELARRVGCAQPTISLIEREAATASRLLLNRIERVLQQEQEIRDRGEVSVRFILPKVPTEIRTSKLPVAVTEWHRPEYAGDFLACLPLERDSLLIAAVDVAGHGTSALPVNLFLQGWLWGWIRGQGRSVRLEGLIAELSEELSNTGIDVSGFFAILSHLPNRRHSIAYEAVSCGFPPPLLITGPPIRTLHSANIDSSLPVADKHVQPFRIESLAAPWRLVIATDGLLNRLGGGDETGGLKSLRRWQTGPRRDAAVEEKLGLGDPVIDDELLAILWWDGWDVDAVIEIDNHEERHRILHMIRAKVAEVGEERSLRFQQAIIEAISNARRHAYGGESGLIWVRFRNEETCFRVEVADEGRGNISESSIHAPESGFSLMRHGTDSVSVRQDASGGTVVTLVIDK
jgi:transcriptional regulator with XRE-family HTH domain/anti-sigma regulatory factor (Ser/Thr protein kinase)